MRELLNELVAAAVAYGNTGASDDYRRLLHARESVDAALEAQQAASDETFTAWLCKQMPQGTVIGDPKWWAPKILRAVRAFTEVPAPVAASEPVANQCDGCNVGMLLHGDLHYHEGRIYRCTADRYAHPSAAGVTVLDEWRVVDKDGHSNTDHPVSMRTPADRRAAVGYCNDEWPDSAPHRVMRVCLREEPAASEGASA